MAKLIALRSGLNDLKIGLSRRDLSAQLKQQVLLFDQIGILNLNRTLNSADNILTLDSLDDIHVDDDIPLDIGISRLELEWLTEKEIVFELTTQGLFQKRADKDLVSKYRKIEKEIPKLMKTMFSKRVRKNVPIEKLNEFINTLIEKDSIALRLLSLKMEVNESVNAGTTLPYTEYAREMPETKKADVAQIVINNLPLPDDTTSWEQIIDYRNDPGNQKNLLALRRWIRKTSTEETSKAEIAEEIEWLMNEFQNHMKVHKIKANTETVEVIVKLLPETIENLIKLKFSKIPEPFFAFKKRQINLMEAELNAPGREMAYIIKTQETF